MGREEEDDDEALLLLVVLVVLLMLALLLRVVMGMADLTDSQLLLMENNCVLVGVGEREGSE